MAGADSHTLVDDIRNIYRLIGDNHKETLDAISAVKDDVSTLATKFAVDEQKHADCRKVVMGNGVAPVATRLTRLEIGLALAAIGALVAGIVGVLSPYVWIGHFTR